MLIISNYNLDFSPVRLICNPIIFYFTGGRDCTKETPEAAGTSQKWCYFGLMSRFETLLMPLRCFIVTLAAVQYIHAFVMWSIMCHASLIPTSVGHWDWFCGQWVLNKNLPTLSEPWCKNLQHIWVRKLNCLLYLVSTDVTMGYNVTMVCVNLRGLGNADLEEVRRAQE
jgi:hypothetical protein